VTLSEPSSKAVTVDYASANGTATAGVDYVAVNGALTFAPGETTKTITVPVNADTLDEEDETFSVTLANAVNAVITDAAGTGAIIDDDLPPSLSIGDVTVVEGNIGTTNASFQVVLSAPSGKVVTIDFATADGTAAAPGDYTSASATLTFAPGETSKTVAVPINSDAVDENDEAFTMTLANAANATIARGQAIGTIIDDDSPPVLGALVAAPGSLTVSWPISTRIFVLEISADLVIWQPVTDVTTEGNQHKALIHTIASRGFLRLREP
ncbi:MAG: Calx-beta domain-containing protein, partial [Gammaproteobacteria bacterium]